jgi:hypothetical protein
MNSIIMTCGSLYDLRHLLELATPELYCALARVNRWCLLREKLSRLYVILLRMIANTALLTPVGND